MVVFERHEGGFAPPLAGLQQKAAVGKEKHPLGRINYSASRVGIPKRGGAKTLTQQDQLRLVQGAYLKPNGDGCGGSGRSKPSPSKINYCLLVLITPQSSHECQFINTGGGLPGQTTLKMTGIQRTKTVCLAYFNHLLACSKTENSS